MASKHFRAGVVAVVRDPDGRVLAFERADVPGQWQLPQGGIDKGEEVVAAAWRELCEETGLGADDVELVGEYPEWLVYEWPDHIRKAARIGQAQRWFFFAPTSERLRPEPDGIEFVAWRWVEPGWLVDQIVDFRRPVYRRVLLEG